jgi:hypothetical protein
MLSPAKIHREIPKPEISIRYLADYLAAVGRSGHRSSRRIIEGCKYRPIGRIVQHNEAQVTLSKFICSATMAVGSLSATAAKIRGRLASDDFERQLWDHNADYIDRFAAIWAKIELPEATICQPGPRLELMVSGCKLTAHLHFRLQRLTKTNKVRIGGGALRYAKGKALPAPVGVWQSAILLGMLAKTNANEDAEPEGKLCITIDAYTGGRHLAPTNAVTRFKEAEAACTTIAQLWPTIKPPDGAVL